MTLCACGCGKPTGLARGTDKRRGYVKGQPLRYLPSHSNGHNGPDPRTERARVREAAILERLRVHGPTHLSVLAELLNAYPSTVTSDVERLLKAGKVYQQVSGTGRGTRRCIRLPDQRPISTKKGIKPNRLGAIASEELLDRALAVFVAGKRLSPTELAAELDITLAEALAAVGQLRLRGQVQNYGTEAFRLMPQERAA